MNNLNYHIDFSNPHFEENLLKRKFIQGLFVQLYEENIINKRNDDNNKNDKISVMLLYCSQGVPQLNVKSKQDYSIDFNCPVKLQKKIYLAPITWKL